MVDNHSHSDGQSYGQIDRQTLVDSHFVLIRKKDGNPYLKSLVQREYSVSVLEAKKCEKKKSQRFVMANTFD